MQLFPRPVLGIQYTGENIAEVAAFVTEHLPGVGLHHEPVTTSAAVHASIRLTLPTSPVAKFLLPDYWLIIGYEGGFFMLDPQRVAAQFHIEEIGFAKQPDRYTLPDGVEAVDALRDYARFLWDQLRASGRDGADAVFFVVCEVMAKKYLLRSGKKTAADPGKRSWWEQMARSVLGVPGALDPRSNRPTFTPYRRALVLPILHDEAPLVPGVVRIGVSFRNGQYVVKVTDPRKITQTFIGDGETVVADLQASNPALGLTLEDLQRAVREGSA